MGERGSAHRASVIQIFAYAGYKRGVQTRFGWSFRSCGVVFVRGKLPLSTSPCGLFVGLELSRMWMEAPSLHSGPVLLFPGLEFWHARVDFSLVSRACLTCCFWSGARFRLAVPILRGRDGACAFLPPPVRTSGRTSGPTSGPTARAGVRHELGSGPRGTTQREVATPFLFLFMGLCKCLWEGACG